MNPQTAQNISRAADRAKIREGRLLMRGALVEACWWLWALAGVLLVCYWIAVILTPEVGR